jgi:LAS superfamily LD-carboxypeptidase LdcB
MRSIAHGRWVVVFVSGLMTIVALSSSLKAEAAPHNSKPQKTVGAKSGRASAAVLPKASTARPSCGQCDRAQQAKKVAIKKSAKSRQKTACHPKGYVDPKIARNYNRAMRELKQAGIKPTVTSAWRSSDHQASLHKCSRSKRCRRAHPGLYYAKPAGQSLHEAGFAVDISGVASGPRGNKRLTQRGRKIVSVMEKNGFDWRYGLADPAHFEADPRRHGYRSVKQAINRSQSQCTLRVAKKATPKKSTGVRATAKATEPKRASSEPVAQNRRTKNG